jgi:hypothetical protein
MSCLNSSMCFSVLAMLDKDLVNRRSRSLRNVGSTNTASDHLENLVMVDRDRATINSHAQ